VPILEVSAFHEPSRIEQRLVTCNLSLVTGDLERSGPSVSQSPVTSYQLPVTSLMCVHEPPEFMAPTHVRILEVFPFHEPSDCRLPIADCRSAVFGIVAAGGRCGRFLICRERSTWLESGRTRRGLRSR